MTTIENATVQDVIDSAATYYNVDPLYAKAVAFQKSEFNYQKNDKNGVGLYALEPTTGLTHADLLNPITNAYVGIEHLVGTAPDAVAADLMKAAAGGLFPPNWTTNISKPTRLTVTYPEPETTYTPTEAPESAPTDVGVGNTELNDSASESTTPTLPEELAGVLIKYEYRIDSVTPDTITLTIRV